MRKIDKAVADPDLRAEYDFSTMAGGVRGKYVGRYRTGVNLVLLEPEVAEAFPTDEAVKCSPAHGHEGRQGLEATPRAREQAAVEETSGLNRIARLGGGANFQRTGRRRFRRKIEPREFAREGSTSSAFPAARPQRCLG